MSGVLVHVLSDDQITTVKPSQDERIWGLERDIEEQKKGHHRLREELQKTIGKYEALKDQCDALKTKVDNQKTIMDGPVDVGKIVGNWRIVLGVAGLAASSIAGNYYVVAPIKQEITAIRIQVEDNTRLQDERRQSDRTQMTDIRQRVDLLTIQFQQFKDAINDEKRKNNR